MPDAANKLYPTIESVMQWTTLHCNRSVRPFFCTNTHVEPIHGRSESFYLPVLIGAGKLRTNLVVPAGMFTDCKPYDGDTALAAARLTEIVPPTTQLGIRTKYVKGLLAVTVVVKVSLNG
jgi:hypothetical protein